MGHMFSISKTNSWSPVPSSSVQRGWNEIIWMVEIIKWGKNTVFCMLGHSMIHKNKFHCEVMNAVIARELCSALFSTLHNANNTKTSTGTDRKVSLQSKGFSPIERFLSNWKVSPHWFLPIDFSPHNVFFHQVITLFCENC